MGDDARLFPRQIWAQPTTTTTKTYAPGCTPFLLPSAGRVYLDLTSTLTLTENAVYEPICTGQPTHTSHASAVLDTRDPFYSSITPQLYAIGCATVVSYLLVIILLITPRTFYVGGPGGGANFLGRHGMISGSYSGNSSVVGVGGRPWLQKVAAILVAISLTIATADSFKVAEQQYNYGYSDAEALTEQVIDGLEIRIVRVISSTFLWLAQVQTLIRLFPRHKEKIMIKWAGFALIVLDTIFSILDNFLVKSETTRPRLYDDAIPALSYLFELALNLLYAAWVIFYSLSKHRFAFFHPKMRNICLVALLSLCAVLIPVVFFVLDIAKPEIAGWGTYIRWVGSAAASVVVWEWVERIEALERDESKDGILGREIFDGDEMLEVTPSEEVDWPRQPFNGPDGGGGTGTSSGWAGVMGLAHRPLRTRVGRNRRDGRQNQRNSLVAPPRRTAPRPTPPPVAVTPISRADTTSAASTVYNVRYHPVSSPTPPVAMPQMEEEREVDEAKELTAVEESQPSTSDGTSAPSSMDNSAPVVQPEHRWRSVLNPFRRRRASLPREIASAQAEEEQSSVTKEVDLSDDEEHARWAVRSRADHLFPFQRGRRPGSGRQGTDAPLPVTVIPARRQGQNAWSPQWFDDSSLLEPAQNHHAPSGHPSGRSTGPHASHHSAGHRNLPVRVIPSQTRSSAPWTTPDGEAEFRDGNYGLRYDPEAAALVGPDSDTFHTNSPAAAHNARDNPLELSFTGDTSGESDEQAALHRHTPSQDIEQSHSRHSSEQPGAFDHRTTASGGTPGPRE